MAEKLLSGKTLKTLHIALFLILVLFGGKVDAQSVLLPGDLVVVSANADTHAIDFMPLIDIEQGTTVYFSNGNWDQTLQYLDGNEIRVTFNEAVPAGTNIHLNDLEDRRITVNGSIEFTGDTHHLFAYQKEIQVYRFIFAMGWGKAPIWSSPDQNIRASDIPLTLKETPHTLLTLDSANNQQYYIRNGASGTRNLLLKMVGDETHWRSSDETPFPIFGTSFNMLKPPVILFDESVSRVSENDSVTTLKIAIYEHDASRLSVDVHFDTLRSVASKKDFNTNTSALSTTLNFTGLMGDAVMEIPIPIMDDAEYEGLETGIFTLHNLSKGNFGDFMSHSIMIEDNEIPDVQITQVVNSRDRTGYIEITNNEMGVVSLDGWTLKGENRSHMFTSDVVLYPSESLKWYDAPKRAKVDSSAMHVLSNSKKSLLNSKGGVLTLSNYRDQVISQVNYSKFSNAAGEEMADNQATGMNDRLALMQDSEFTEQMESQLNVTTSISTGWKVLSYRDNLTSVFKEKKFYTWSETKRQFEELNLSDTQKKPELVFGYFEGQEVESVTDWNTTEIESEDEISKLELSLSARDLNDNGTIDQVEGLNMEFNSLMEVIQVNNLRNAIQLGMKNKQVEPVIYGVRLGKGGDLNFVKLSDEERIAPNVPFLVFVDEPITDQSLTFSAEDLKSEIFSEPDASGSEDEKSGILELSFGNSTFSSSLKIYIEQAAASKTRVKDLNAYPALFLPAHSYLHASIVQGQEYYKELSLSAEAEQSIELPLQLNTSESGKFNLKVSDWEQIPSEWKVTLVDRLEGKEYELRKDMVVNFDHMKSGATADEKINTAEKWESFKDTDRFVILFEPPSASKQSSEAEVADVPRELELHQNFPNPFNPVTVISFYLPESEEVKLSVFNIVGQPVAVLVEGSLSPGEHQFEWDATDKPSGMYIYQLEVGKSVMTRKMTLVK